jgi:hypothetical protein
MDRMRKCIRGLSLCLLVWTMAESKESCLFTEAWNTRVQLVTTEQGEKLGIAAVCAFNQNIYLYSRGNRCLICYDTTGRYVRTIALESIGRNTYVGDDFVVRDSAAFFINSVDRTLERFDLVSGRRITVTPLPKEPFQSQTQRVRRVINRIFIVDRVIYIGNNHLLVEFDPTNPGQVRLARSKKASAQTRFALLTAGSPVISRPDGSLAWLGRVRIPPKSAIECTGKQCFVLNNRLFTIAQDNSGLKVVELK